MKYSSFCIAILLLLGFSIYTHAQTVTEKILQVETGLSNYNYIKGEPTWTIEERMVHYGVPGMSIAVVHDYKIAWTKNYGYVDKEQSSPVTDNTLFQAASISKPVSAYAALKMVEDGQLALDKNVNDYLTSWQIPENEFTEIEKVTLERLVSHKAGMTVHGFWGYSSDLEVPNLIDLLNGKGAANSDPILVDKTPGGDMRYSGGGYCVMQQMMIDVAKQDYKSIMQESVLGPIGMTKSTFAQPLPPDQLKLAATGYLSDGSMTKGKRHTYPEMAAAGLWTNAGELAKFVIDLQQTLKGNSEKVLSSEMARQMVTPVEGDFVGLGIFLRDGRFGHGGWNEGFSSNMAGHIEDGYGAVVMLNANHPDLINEIMNSIMRSYEWDKAPPIHIKHAYTKEELDRIVAKYDYGFDDNITVYEKEGTVYLKYLNGNPEELLKIGENTFVRRERKASIQFLSNPQTGKPSLVFLPEQENGELEYKKKITTDEKLPIEFLIDGDFNKALLMYKSKQKEEPDYYAVQEYRINNLGYQQLEKDNVDEAIAIFKLNVALHPEAYDPYDSLAEGYMAKGEKELAIQFYKKSLELNPNNSNAVEMLKKLNN